MALAKFDTDEELEAAFESYKKWALENPIKKPEMMKSGKLQGEQIDILIPRPWSIEDFCIHAGMTSVTWRDWRKTNRYPTILPRIDDEILNQQANGATVDMYNHAIVAKRLGMVDKKEVEVNDVSGYEILE